MALDLNATQLEQLIDPEVLAPIVNSKMVNRLKFKGLATLDYTLQGRPGSTVTVPVYKYIGDATDVLEGADIPIAQLTTDSETFTIKKAGKGVQITDEALLSGYGDPIGEATSQLALSIASKLNKDVAAALVGIVAPMIHNVASGGLTSDVVADAKVKFGEEEFDDEGNVVRSVLIVSPAQYALLRKDAAWMDATELGVNALHSGIVGAIHGCQVEVSADITTENYIVKEGALRVFLKRDTMVERDRDIINKTWVLTADKHYGAYLYDASGAIKITYIAG